MKLFTSGFLITAITFAFFGCSSNTASVPKHLPIQDTLRVIKKDTISIIAVGDIMLGSAYPSKSNLPPDGAINSFKNVAGYLKGDIVFGNLEGCFLNNGKSTKCKDTISNSCFAFRMPENYAGIIQNAGFNLLSIANNHVGDFGLKGRTQTVTILDSLNIHYAGLQSHPFRIFEKDSIKYAFCAFAPNENTVSINKVDQAIQLVKRLRHRHEKKQ